MAEKQKAIPFNPLQDQARNAATSQIAMDESPNHLPSIYKRPLKKFPLPNFRRVALRLGYLGARTQDWLS